jgi:hypothetical protein
MKDILKESEYNVSTDGNVFLFNNHWYDLEDFFPELSGKADYIMAEGFHTIYVKLNKDGTADIERYGPIGFEYNYYINSYDAMFGPYNLYDEDLQ